MKLTLYIQLHRSSRAICSAGSICCGVCGRRSLGARLKGGKGAGGKMDITDTSSRRSFTTQFESHFVHSGSTS